MISVIAFFCLPIVGDNQKETTHINHGKGAPYSLPRGSILAMKPYLRTLTDPARILTEPALTNNKRQSKLEVQASIKLFGECPWSPEVYCALRLLGNMLEVAWERMFIRTSHF